MGEGAMQLEGYARGGPQSPVSCSKEFGFVF